MVLTCFSCSEGSIEEFNLKDFLTFFSSINLSFLKINISVVIKVILFLLCDTFELVIGTIIITELFDRDNGWGRQTVVEDKWLC